MATPLTTVLQSNLPQGPTGAQGPTGPQGTNGSNGTQGTQGVQGTTGTQGTNGTQGVQGTTGAQGAQGVQGVQGRQGVQGVQGSTGPSTAINATAYTSGTYYPVMVPSTGTNQTPYAHTTLNYASGTLSATDFASTSDMRLKNVMGFVDNAANKLDYLNGVYYRWNDLAKRLGYDEQRGDRDEVGLLAQEVEAILPQAVYADENGYLRISYDRIVPVLIEALKEHSRQIKELREKLESK